MHPNVHCSTSYKSQDMEAAYMSTDGGLDKEDVVHIYSKMENYSAIKKNKITSFAATWIDLAIVILSESKKYKYMILLI